MNNKTILPVQSVNTYHATCHYPEENCDEVISDITYGLQYIGIFDCLNMEDKK